MSDDKKAWLLDLDGTLYRAGPLKYAMAAELALMGAGAIKALRAFRPHHEHVRADMLADPTLEFSPNAFEEQLRRAVAESGIAEPKMRATVEEWMIRRPVKWMRRFQRNELVRRVIDFRAQGGKTALVSDYPATVKIKGMGIDEHFDVIVSSGEHTELHRLKPAPDAFLIAARELGVEPGACHVIGDRDDADGGAARAAGMSFELIK